jgi:general secretion pathway protein G
MARGERAGISGFTLIEMVIVLAIIAIIAALIGPMAFQFFSAQQGSAVQSELETIYRAIVGDPGNGSFGYVGDVGAYPASLMDLMVQPKDSLNVPVPGWKGPYLQNPRAETGVLLDPFGRPYEYLLRAVTSGAGNVFAVVSRGADGTSTNTATSPNVATNYVGALPTETSYPTAAQNADNVVFPSPSSANALDKTVSGEVAFNILNFDTNSKVNAFVPACPQLFNITATSVTRATNDVENLPYVQGLTFDLAQGQYQIKVVPQGQTTVSWTETVTVLPAATLSRTLNLTGLDSSATTQPILTVVNKFSNVDVEIFEFTERLKGAAVGSVSYNQEDLDHGKTQNYIPRACAQMYIRQKGSTGPVGNNGIIKQFVMAYGNTTHVVGSGHASLTVVNKVEKRLKVFRNNVLVGTIGRGDVHHDHDHHDNHEHHKHIKTKTFGDFADGDLITIYSIHKDHTATLLATLTLIAGSQTVTLQ